MNYLFLFVAPLMASSIFSMETDISAREIRYVTPPNLDDKHLGNRIICYRPVRFGSPKMTVREINGQIIASNYGHGGSGWTLAPAAASYVNSLLENSPYSSELNKKAHITIIGAGVLGLFTAYDLHKRGYKKITIIAEKFENLTSHNAGGLLAPVSMDNKPAKLGIINKIGAEAYKFFASIATNNHPDFKEGASIIPTYFENRKDSGLEPYVKLGVMKAAKNVILDFQNGMKRPMVAYDDGIFIDTAKMMNNLTYYLKKAQVNFRRKTVHSFSDIKSKYIINCAGLGSKQLAKDNKVISVQGHLVMLKDQPINDLKYMIVVYFHDEYINNLQQKVKRTFYIMPKQSGVIGGSFIYGATHKTPNTEEFDIIIDKARTFYGLKKHASL